MRISRDRMAEWELGNGGKGLSSLIPPRDYSGMNVQEVQLRISYPTRQNLG